VTSRVPPQNLEAEASVLGSVLLDNESLVLISDLLAPTDFYKESNRVIFAAMLKLYRAAEPVDVVTLTEVLRTTPHDPAPNALEHVGNTPYLIGLMDGVPTAAYAESYAGIVKEKAQLRALIAAAGLSMQDAYGAEDKTQEILDRFEQRAYALNAAGTTDSFRPAYDIIAENMAALHDLKGGLPGLPTHFTELDKMLAGLQPGSLNVLAARPSQGKTAFALAIAKNVVLRSGGAVGIFSLEMRDAQLMDRIVAAEGRVDMQRLRLGKLTDREFGRYADVSGRLVEAPIYIDDTSDVSIADLRSRARRLMSRHPLKLIIVDYLQLMTANGGENRQQEVSTISRGLKALARELDIPVLVLSQLSRAVEQRPNKRPMLSDLRESGAIEQDADVVMFIYRDEYYNPHSEEAGIAEIIVGKQRNGPVGTVRLQFHNAYATFNNLYEGAPV
jgi:replicative DNA helicase